MKQVSSTQLIACVYIYNMILHVMHYIRAYFRRRTLNVPPFCYIMAFPPFVSY